MAPGCASVPGNAPVELKEHEVIDPRWATRKTDKGWSLTHRGTGLDATNDLVSRAKAFSLARKLNKQFGVKAWAFTEPIKVPKGARQVVQHFVENQGIFESLK